MRYSIASMISLKPILLKNKEAENGKVRITKESFSKT